MDEEREVDKMLKIKEKAQVAGEFLEWLQSKGYRICTYFKDKEYEKDEKDEDESGYYPAHINIEQLLADFFGIDLEKVEKEKRKILDDIREKNKIT